MPEVLPEPGGPVHMVAISMGSPGVTSLRRMRGPSILRRALSFMCGVLPRQLTWL